jgi:Ca2+-binding EF-hand superfamily protein
LIILSKEFNNVLHEMGFTNRNLNIAIYNAQDDDNDHKIQEDEFIEFVKDHDAIVKNLESKSSQYNTMFNEIDVNKNGSITPEELKTYMSTKHPESKGIDRVIARSFKLDSDKKITLEGIIV